VLFSRVHHKPLWLQGYRVAFAGDSTYQPHDTHFAAKSTRESSAQPPGLVAHHQGAHQILLVAQLPEVRFLSAVSP